MDLTGGDELLAEMRRYKVPCVIAAAMDLDVFDVLDESPSSSEEAASRLECDPRAMAILLDALAAIGLLVKTDASGGSYEVSPEIRELLVDTSPRSVAAMLRHQANCLRNWARLPWVVKTGQPPDAGRSLRGPERDRESFIEAMHVISRTVAKFFPMRRSPDRPP